MKYTCIFKLALEFVPRNLKYSVNMSIAIGPVLEHFFFLIISLICKLCHIISFAKRLCICLCYPSQLGVLLSEIVDSIIPYQGKLGNCHSYTI